MQIEKLDHYGRGISKYENKTCFIENALPGEDVEIEITKNKKQIEAVATSICSSHKSRVVPICPYYDLCGGCHIMHMSYKMQLEFKENKVREILKKFANYEERISSIVSSCFTNYRNKVIFHVKDGKIGFYQKKTNQITEVSFCYLVCEEINALIPILKKFVRKEKGLEQIEVRVGNQTGEILLSLTGRIQDYGFLLPHVSVLAINHQIVSQKSSIFTYIGDKKYILSDLSFFQVNQEVTKLMYDKIRSLVSRTHSYNVLDLYCGAGTIGIYISDLVNQVLGIEVVSNAIFDAKENAKLNSISNISFLLGKVEDKIDMIGNQYDTIIVDPPRNGLHKNVIHTILKISPKTIIYVSCDPVTMARDISLLSDSYQVIEVTPFDMFPNTYHVECVCVLKLK